MKRYFYIFLVAIIFIWSSPANSATVVNRTGDMVTGITGLDVDGNQYNVVSIRVAMRCEGIMKIIFVILYCFFINCGKSADP